MGMRFCYDGLGTSSATLLSIVTSDITKEHGKIAGHLLVDGTLDDPFVHTLLSLDKVGFELPSLGVEYKDINMEAEIENGQLAISTFEGAARFSEQVLVDLSSWGTFNLDSTAAYSESGIQGTTRLGLKDFPSSIPIWHMQRCPDPSWWYKIMRGQNFLVNRMCIRRGSVSVETSLKLEHR